LWDVKTKVIIMWVRWGNRHHLEIIMKHLSNIPGKGDVQKLQPTTILDTAHILRRVLIEKYKTFTIINTVTFTVNCNYRLAASLYTPEIKFVLCI